jgi:signal transduction histidine kinase
MLSSPRSHAYGLDPRLLTAFAVAVAVAVFVITWVTINESRSDSYELLRAEGAAFTEALAQASENAIAAGVVYDNLLHDRYRDLVASLQDLRGRGPADQELVAFARLHDLQAVYVYDNTATLVIGATARGPYQPPPAFVQAEAAELLASPEANFALLMDDSGDIAQPVHYYLELTGRVDEVIALEIDALYYSEAVRQTGIGYLAQRMAGEPGVEYIIYQSKEGIVFSSRRITDILAIESDPFLSEALSSDSVVSRVTDFQGAEVLEMVRPFSSKEYPYGLFRVGLSLDRYERIIRGFDRQLMILSGALVILLLVFVLYVQARRRRKELSRQYTDMKAMTDLIFEQMETGVAVVDAVGVVRLANGAFESIFDCPHLVGRRWLEALPTQGELIAVPTTKADEREIILEGPSGRKAVLLSRSRLEAAAESPSVVLVASDVTQMKEYEKASARKERLSEMGHLAAGVAHEIRNPLNTISIAAQRLASEFTPDRNSEQYAAFTQQIRTETSRLNQIITRFLALTREEKRERHDLDLSQLLDDVGAFLRLEGEGSGLTVGVDCPPGTRVTAGADALRQVLINLFNNSKEALSGHSGTFNIRARAVTRKVVIEVSDDGPGIPTEHRDKVFAPFYTTKDAGTGLGLATVQRIVSDLGGDIELDPGHSPGAKFIITLPAA